MQADDVVHRIAARLGGASAREGLGLLEATLEELGATLPAQERRLLCDGLDEPLARIVRRRERRAGRRLEALPEALAEREGISPARALEVLEVACEAIGAQLGSERADLLARRVGPPFADWITPRRYDAAEPRRSRPPRAPTRPLSETGPSPRSLASARPERAQSESLARTDEPHRDDKLSSGATEQVREHEDLATGRPGSRHPLSREGS